MKIRILGFLLIGLCFASSAYAAPGQLSAPSPAPQDGFGAAVALDDAGTELLVGAATLPFALRAGAAMAHLYTLVNGQWQLTSTFTCSQGTYGAAVALSRDGKTAMISGGSGACLYRASSHGWLANPATVATFPGAPLGTPIGVALSSDGNTALAGAALYQASGNTWTATPTAVAAFSVSGNNELGTAVALSSDGNTALLTDPLTGNAIGCTTSNDGDGNGVAYVFQASNGVWAASPLPVATLLSATTCQRLGWSAAMSSDGNIVLLGAPHFSNNQGNPAGAFIFEASSGAWAASPSALAEIEAGDGFASLGQSAGLSADGKTALLGDYGDNIAKVVHAVNGSWQGIVVPGMSFTGNSCDFAYSLALSGDGLTSVAGAPSCPGHQAGSAFTTAVPVAVYAPPVASSSSLSVGESGAQDGTLSATPASAGDTLSFTIASRPMHGSVSLLDASTGDFEYQPQMGYSGTDSFTFNATDNQNLLTSSTAKVSISVSQTGGGGALDWLGFGFLAGLYLVRRQIPRQS